jgi:hypothetical protein
MQEEIKIEVKKTTEYCYHTQGMITKYRVKIGYLTSKTVNTYEEALAYIEDFKNKYVERKEELIEVCVIQDRRFELVLEKKWDGNWYIVYADGKVATVYMYDKDKTEEENNEITKKRYVEYAQKYLEPVTETVHEEVFKKD